MRKRPVAAVEILCRRLSAPGGFSLRVGRVLLRKAERCYKNKSFPIQNYLVKLSRSWDKEYVNSKSIEGLKTAIKCCPFQGLGVFKPEEWGGGGGGGMHDSEQFPKYGDEKKPRGFKKRREGGSGERKKV